jgi:hypothetical protein
MGKYTYEFVKQEFDERGYELISKYYINTRQKLEYVCKKHKDKGIQQISFSKFHGSNQGCTYCGRERTANARKAIIDELEDKSLCEKNNFTYVNTYIENHVVKISFICNKHRDLGVQTMHKNNMKRKIKGCKYCSGKDLPEWYVLKKAKEINPYIRLDEPYNNLTTRMKCTCTKHNVQSNKTMQEILSGKGCYLCGIEKLSNSSFLTIEEYQKKVELKNPDITVLEYKGQRSDAYFECKLCGHKWHGSAAGMIMHGTSCPNCCHYYIGEKAIKDLLEKWGYKYITQYRFKDCKDQRSLPFDFYLPEFNTCIEYDGIYHFENRFNSLETVKKHDEIKTNYCKNNKIKLIRINCFDEDIEYSLFDKMVKNGLIREIK